MLVEHPGAPPPFREGRCVRRSGQVLWRSSLCGVGRGLQLRDSAGLRPAFPLGPLASERQGTLTVAVI